MTVKVKEIRRRLDEHSTVMELKERDMERMLKILKAVGKTDQGLSISEMKKHYLGGDLDFSNTHLVASLSWLKEKGYLSVKKGKKRKIPYILSEEGRVALQDLDDYFYFPETSLKMSWNLLDRIEGEASLTTKLPNITKTAVFSSKFIRDRILELSAALFFPQDVTLTIRIPAIRNQNVLAFLRILWGFYWQKVTEPSVKPNPFGPLYINMYLTDEKGIESYTEFWKKHVKKFLQLDGHFFKSGIHFGGKKLPIEEPLYPVLPRELIDLFPAFLNYDEIVQWIESQLEKNPDWFMPHILWVKLGFKQRK